jgi:hypothetical protein
MNTGRSGADLRVLDDSPLPETATRVIHTLACKVALCSRMPPGEREVVATIRGRPKDRQGRTGCHAEFYTAGPPPRDGLQAVQRAGGEMVMPETTMGKRGQFADQPVVALHGLSMDEMLLGGWRVTMDLRWAAA